MRLNSWINLQTNSMERELYTKSIFKPRAPEDSRHISVMSRHTLNDGVTPDDRIIEGESYDEWLKALAPPDQLVGRYYRNEVSWEEYENEYKKYLNSDAVKPILTDFSKRCEGEPITLLCVEESPEKCHRRILAEELQKLNPKLNIKHL